MFTQNKLIYSIFSYICPVSNFFTLNFVRQVKTINMETEDLDLLKNSVHHGHNIRRIRQDQGLKQEAMAILANLSQQTVSRYETMKVIDKEMLERFAKALKVPVELLETMEEDAPMVVFENNNVTNTNNDNVDNNIGADFNKDNHIQNTFNPIEKIVELYERLLKEEKEKFNNLEKRLSALEQQQKK